MALFVAICDDEKKICAQVERILIKTLDDLSIKYEIDVYFTGEQLCEKIENGVHYDLIFLDIQFAENSINGIEVGKHIREAHRNEIVSIVYISWESRYSMQLFEIRPFHFLIKPLDDDKLEQVIKTYIKTTDRRSSDFTYKIGHDDFKVQIKDIVYLESKKRKIALHLADGRKMEFYGMLKEIYHQQLQKFDFLLIHASFAVNYDYISALKYDEVVLANGVTTLPVSRNKRNEVREAYYAIVERRRV